MSTSSLRRHNFKEVRTSVWYAFLVMTIFFWGFFALLFIYTGGLEGPEAMIALFYFIYILPVLAIWGIVLSLFALITQRQLNHKYLWWMPIALMFVVVGIFALI